MSATDASCFRFVQLDVPGRLGLDDGRYLVRPPAARTDDEERSWSSRRWAPRPPGGGRRRQRRRPQPADPGDGPTEVPITRLTVIPADACWTRASSRRSSSALRADPAATEEAVTEGLREVNRVVRAHRIASQDPYGHEIATHAAIAVGSASGPGDGARRRPVGGGRRGPLAGAPPAPRRCAAAPGAPGGGARRPRADRRLRDAAAPRARRPRPGPPREAALQLRAGLDALLAELPDRAGPGQEEDLATLRARRESTGEAAARGAPRRPVGRARWTSSPRRSRSASASCAAVRRSGNSAQPSRRREHGLQVLGHVAVQPHGGIGVVGGRAPGDDRDPPAVRQRQPGQAGHRMDLERGADAEQQVGADEQSCSARAIASAGRSSPNRTTSGFTLPAQPVQVATPSASNSDSTCSSG